MLLLCCPTWHNTNGSRCCEGIVLNLQPLLSCSQRLASGGIQGTNVPLFLGTGCQQQTPLAGGQHATIRGTTFRCLLQNDMVLSAPAHTLHLPVVVCICCCPVQPPPASGPQRRIRRNNSDVFV